MPSDKIEKKNGQELNNYYFSYMNRADSLLKESLHGVEMRGVNTFYRKGKTPPNRIEAYLDEEHKKSVMFMLAKSIAYARIAKKYGKKDPQKLNDEKLNQEADQKQAEILKSSEFQIVIGSMSFAELYDFLGKKEEGQERRESVKFAEFAQKYTARSKELAPQLKQARMSDLVTTIEHSTQKSFFGKLKNIFTGNSQLYEDALKAMRELANGTSKDKFAAQGAIEDYIVNRGNKVRDHQYGRDRFDAFMKGLGEISTPEQFMRTVTKVNRERARNGEPMINGADYLQALPEKKEAFEELAQQAERKEQAELAKDLQTVQKRETEATMTEDQKKQQLAEADEAKIKADYDVRNVAETLEVGEQTITLTLLQNHQVYLDRLRNLNMDKVRTPYTKERKYFESIQKRIDQHPYFRLAAQQVIRQKAAVERQQGKAVSENLGFKIPETHLDRMKPESVKKLQETINDFQTLDRQKHPDMDIKPIKVEAPQKTGPQAGDGGPTL